MNMNPFSLEPPAWASQAIHSVKFSCPQCQASAAQAENVWINRRAPALTPENRRIWQEFYHCQCGQAWWSWSSDRPPNPALSENPDNQV